MFINKHHITLNDLFTSNKRKIKNLIRQSYPPMDWRAGMVEELLHAVDGVVDFGFTREELMDILNTVCIDNDI